MKKILFVILIVCLSSLSIAGAKEEGQEITKEQAIELAKHEGLKHGYSEEWFGGPVYVDELGPLTGYHWHILVFPKTNVFGGLFQGCFTVRVSSDGMRTQFEKCVLNRL